MRYFMWVVCFLFSSYGNAQIANPQQLPQPVSQEPSQLDYPSYHRAIVEAERLVSQKAYETALGSYQYSFATYRTGFLKDYKIAAQLAFYLGKTSQGFSLLQQAIAHGWELKDIKKMSFYDKISAQTEWKTITNQYATSRETYLQGIHLDVRKVVHQLFRKDQRKAFRALFLFTTKARDRYGKRVFAPHSERQVQQLNKIMATYGYPGEKLIGNSYWASVILSHHNSMYGDYVKTDTLYPQMRSRLLQAVDLGQMSPREFARVDDWYQVIKSEGNDNGYGYIRQVETKSEQEQADQRRAQVGISSLEVVRKLLAIERETGLTFYLSKM
ncbi:hypothetical protein GCM10028819_09860 [Spirosoma humi]